MSRITDYTDEVLSRGVITSVVEAFSRSGELLATTRRSEAGDAFVWEVDSPGVRMGSGLVSQRSASLAVSVTDPAVLVPKVGGLTHPDSDNRVRFSAGLRKADGSVDLFPLGTMLIREAKAVESGGVVQLSLELTDAIDPVRGNLDQTIQIADGERVDAAVARLLGLVLDGPEFVVEATDYTLPAVTIPIGAPLIDVIEDMLAGVGHELTADPYGLVVTREIPPTDDDQTSERWKYGTGGGIPIAGTTRVWRSRVPQAVKVEGGSLLTGSITASVVVVDTDPTSEGHWAPGSRSRSIETIQVPWSRSRTQSIQAGYARLRTIGTGPAVVQFSTVPNPAMRQGDLIELGSDLLNASGTYRVRGFELPVGAALMTVTARATYDPAVNYEAPIDPSEGGIAAFNDTFNRPDQNLENLPGSPGNDNWTEVGYSWGIVGEQAIQRYDRGWSLAYPNTNLFYSDHRAIIDVVRIPAGRHLGPMIRYDGSGKIAGYAALADSAGRVSLERWQAGRSVAVLASWAGSGPLDGKTLALEGEGPTLRVKVGAVVVLTASDSAASGLFAGMLGYGGVGVNAPVVDEFTIEETA